MDYKQKYIELNKALTALKRGKPSDWDLKVLGCSVDEFWNVNQYLVANNFNVKERSDFIKRLEKLGVDLFDSYWLKQELDKIRIYLNKFPDSTIALAKEEILGNLLFNSKKKENN